MCVYVVTQIIFKPTINREYFDFIIITYYLFLKNRVSTFWNQYKNEMVRREKLN